MATIFALSSAAGAAGVAVIRLSGPQVKDALAALGMPTLPSPRLATLRRLTGAAGDVLDEALILYFPAPHSFTGEDVAELHLHGSRAVVQAVLAALAAVPGLRLAEAGEFTRQAFLNGKMDLTAAEGIADLIHAETESQRKQALRQLGGQTAQQLEDWRAAILHEMAMVEAYIDFPDEDIPTDILHESESRIRQVAEGIARQLDDNRIGERIRDGLSIAILGAPNVGKSTLLNHLAARDVAIVADWPGTTRDVLETHLTIAGHPVTLADTAGLRETQDPIEQEGIRRARGRAESADLVLLLKDAAADGDFPTLPEALHDRPVIYIQNKLDAAPDARLSAPVYNISLTTGEGVPQLIAALETAVRERMESATPPLITRQRHRLLLQECLQALGRFSLTALPPELAAEELRTAAFAIGRLTGRVSVDEILDKVFSSFCIGK